ncbi:hypothetical protein FRC06_000216 [Ceratobasidium sp. 370]|nr:hypothetical protein FRC06_000216 [Ceratobasidium sp. 370]
MNPYQPGQQDAPPGPFHQGYFGFNPNQVLPPLPPPLPPPPPPPPPPIDYDHLSSLVSNQVVDRVVAGVADQVAELIASWDGPARGQASGRGKKRRERCGSIQRVITKVMLAGLQVGKADEIGSASQPGPLDLDEDDEAPWVIDWQAGPNGPANREVVARWVQEVLQDEAVSRTSDEKASSSMANLPATKMQDLLQNGTITEAQCSERYVRLLLIHSFDTARKFIKINEDVSGERMERLQAAKDKGKRKQRQKDLRGSPVLTQLWKLCNNRREASKTRFWQGKPIPALFFKPEYHSDSEADPEPDVSQILDPISAEGYKRRRNGADYEMLTPGWRSDEITKAFHWLDEGHRKDTNNRPQGTRYYHYSHRKFGMSDIPDNAPRCMINDKTYNDVMDDEKRGLVLPSPAGWKVQGEDE